MEASLGTVKEMKVKEGDQVNLTGKQIVGTIFNPDGTKTILYVEPNKKILED